MADNISSILDIIKPETAKEIVLDSKAAFAELKRKGMELIGYVESIVLTFEAAEKYTQLNTKMQKTYEAMRDYESITRLLVDKGQEFEVALNQFLNRTVNLAYVDKDGSLIVIEEAKVGRLYAEATKNRGRGNISAARFRKTVSREELNAEFQKDINEIVASKKKIYTEAIRRYEDTIKAIQQRQYYWQLNQEREYSPTISNKGRIAEAYAEAVLTEDAMVVDSPQIAVERGLQALVRHIEEDNVGAAIKGDVQVKGDGKIFFAIKEGSFSTPRIGQYYALAVNLQDIPEMTPEELESRLAELTNMRSVADKIESNAFQFANEEAIREIKSLKGVNFS